MRLPVRQDRGAFGFNMTPMIDVVFLLIIFFLVSSHLARSEAQLQLPLPQAASGEEQDEQAPRVVINITETGELSVAGRKIAERDLASFMQGLVAEQGADEELRVRAASQVPYGRIAPVIRAAAEAGFWNINFAVVPSE